MSRKSPNILIVAGDFYADIAGHLIGGAEGALKAAGASWNVERVPGALEIPAAIGFAIRAGLAYDGYVALGCVIRGETSHYDYVCAESARALMDIAMDNHAVGNGILTVNRREQALKRAIDKNKGAAAARACLAMVELKARMGSKS